MQAAQCLAIKEGSDEISEAILSGFFGMVKSDITMKQSETNSQLQSKMGLLMSLSKDISGKHLRMQDDLQRLHAHYNAIFKDLDKDLKKRIKELDKSAFQICERGKEKIVLEPSRTLVAATADAMASNNRSIEMITLSRTRYNVSKVLQTMANSIKRTVSYKKTMNDTLFPIEEIENKLEYIPVIYCVTKEDTSSQNTDKYYLPDLKEKERVISAVSKYVNSKTLEDDSNVEEKELETINREFLSIIENQSREGSSEEKDRRVYLEILKMWNNDKAFLKC